MPDNTKEILLGELKRVHGELKFQRDIRNAREPWEIDSLDIMRKHKGNLWAAALEFGERMEQVEAQGLYQGMIHELHEVMRMLGVPDEEVLTYERGLLGLVETFPGSNVFVQSDQGENYRR